MRIDATILGGGRTAYYENGVVRESDTDDVIAVIKAPVYGNVVFSILELIDKTFYDQMPEDCPDMQELVTMCNEFLIYVPN